MLHTLPPARPRPPPSLRRRLTLVRRPVASLPPSDPLIEWAGGEGGNGAGKGGGGGGGGKGGGGGGGDRGRGPWWRPPAAALLAGATAGAAVVATSRRRRAQAEAAAAAAAPPPPPPPPANPFARLAAVEADVARLRRLTRDAFQAVTETADRVDALDGGGAKNDAPRGGARGAAAAAAGHFAPLGALRRRAGAPAHAPAAPPGAVSVEGEVVTDATARRRGRASDGPLALTLRTRLRACVHGPARGGADAFYAQIDAVESVSGAGRVAGGGAPSPPPPSSAALTKAIYSAALAPRCRLLLVPVGARGSDVAPTLNPVAGAGLSAAARHGCRLHARAAGAAVAARWRSPRFGAVAARFLPGASRPDVAASTLLQADAALSPGASVGVAALVDAPRRSRSAAGRRPSDAPWSPSPPPSDDGASDDSRTTSSSLTGGARGGGLAAAATAALALDGGAMLGAWAAAGAPGDTRGVDAAREWGVTLASPPRAGGEGWLLAAAGAGRRATTAEASATVRLGVGLTVTPGVVVGGGGVAVACRSVVAF